MILDCGFVNYMMCLELVGCGENCYFMLCVKSIMEVEEFEELLDGFVWVLLYVF